MSHRSPTVLLVEPDMNRALRYRTRLGTSWQIEHAADGAAAIRAFTEHEPVAVLIQLRQSGDALALCQQIRGLFGGSHAAILIYGKASASARAQLRGQAAKSQWGFDAALDRNPEPPALKEALREALQRRGAARAASKRAPQTARPVQARSAAASASAAPPQNLQERADAMSWREVLRSDVSLEAFGLLLRKPIRLGRSEPLPAAG